MSPICGDVRRVSSSVLWCPPAEHLPAVPTPSPSPSAGENSGCATAHGSSWGCSAPPQVPRFLLEPQPCPQAPRLGHTAAGLQCSSSKSHSPPQIVQQFLLCPLPKSQAQPCTTQQLSMISRWWESSVLVVVVGIGGATQGFLTGVEYLLRAAALETSSSSQSPVHSRVRGSTQDGVTFHRTQEQEKAWQLPPCFPDRAPEQEAKPHKSSQWQMLPLSCGVTLCPHHMVRL